MASLTSNVSPKHNIMSEDNQVEFPRLLHVEATVLPAVELPPVRCPAVRQGASATHAEVFRDKMDPLAPGSILFEKNGGH